MHRGFVARRIACRAAVGAVAVGTASAGTASTQRPFANFFSSLSKPADTAIPSPLHEDKEAVAKINVADLANGDDMPPLLQYNGQLVEAALALLEFANRKEGATEEELGAVSGIVGMLFEPSFVGANQQYLAVARLTDIPEVRKDKHLLDACHAIFMTIMPTTLAELLIAIDTLPEFGAITNEERDIVHGLVEAIIDHGVGDASDGAKNANDPDAVLLAALQAVETGFPALFTNSHFVHLLQNINAVCLQARFAYLMNEACLAFDPERTGRVKLQELKDSLGKLMPPHAVARMMAGVETDDDGTVYYPQMAAILMRGEGPVAPEATKPPQAGTPGP